MEEQYVEKPDEEALMLGAVRDAGPVEDPYTFYYTREEMDAPSRRSPGAVRRRGTIGLGGQSRACACCGCLPVLRLRAGGTGGDRITAVNGHPVSGKVSQQTLDEAVERMKSSPAQLLKLEILRGRTVDPGHGVFHHPDGAVEYRMLENKVGYLAIYEFIGMTWKPSEADAGPEKARGGQGDHRSAFQPRGHAGGCGADRRQPDGEGMIAYTQDRYGNRSEYFSAASRWDVESPCW